MRNNPDDLANQTLNKIKEICLDNIETTELTRETAENVFFDDTHDYELVARKELSQEILNLIKKEEV
jgi:hypothetical protein|tara:strand:- start:533 stop:733 length:201 start_codon:yes stop_codon:yes gene_type:complete